MCCGTEGKHGKHSGCCGMQGIQSEYTPRFMTKDQKISKLEKYRETLLDEAKAVDEHIAQIKEQ